MLRKTVIISLWIAALSPYFTVFGQNKAPQAPTAGLGSLIPMMLVMFAVVYFLMIRPEQKKQKQRQTMLQAIKKGDRVLTTAGILGTVGTVKEATVMVKIAENTVVEFTKSAVSSIVNKDGSEKQATTEIEQK
ncbi:MAG: preprotein translocase subunit YajC [Chitinispirillaceae bacterium]|nr:preprotein translocase subunit YajC [Chitinispirillaceae bacterium]